MKRHLFFFLSIIFFSICLYAAPSEAVADPLKPTFDFKYSWNLPDLIYTGFSNSDKGVIDTFLNNLESKKYSKDWNTINGAPPVIGNQDVARFPLTGEDPYHVSLSGSGNSMKPVYLWIAVRTLNNVNVSLSATPLSFNIPGETHTIPYTLSVKDVTDGKNNNIPITVDSAFHEIASKTGDIYWKFVGELILAADVTEARPRTYTGALTVKIEDAT